MDSQEAATDPLIDGLGAHPRGPKADESSASRLGVLRRVIVGIASILVVMLLLRPGGQPEPVDTSDVSAPTTIAAPPPESVAASLTTHNVDQRWPLGEETGLGAWVGGDSPLAFVNLDTGESTVAEIRGYPLFAIGDDVLVADLAGDRHLLFSNTHPESEPRVLETGAEFRVDLVAPSDVDSTVWLAEVGDDEVRWRLLSTRTMAPVRAASTRTVRTSKLSSQIDLARPPLLDEPTPGSFVSGPGAPTWSFDGHIVALGGSWAIVDRCEPTCRRQWLDLTSGRFDDQSPIPTNLLSDVDNELFAGRRIVHTRADDLLSSAFINTTTGMRLDTSVRTSRRPFDISPDGRWAGITGSRRLWFVDLESGDQKVIGDSGSLVGTGSSVVFVTR